MKHPKYGPEIAVPAIVILLSVINLTNAHAILSLTNLLSLIGIFGSVLFFQNNTMGIKFIYFWIVAQIVIIEPFLDLSQAFKVTFGFGIETANGPGGLYFNIIAIILLGFVKVLEASGLKGKTVTFYEFRESELGNIFPLTGIVKRRESLQNEGHWVLVDLNTPFSYDGKSIRQVLIKRKDNKSLKLKAKNQIIYYRLVFDENDLSTNNPDVSDFPFVEWVICK